jgi:hypothetical protein
MPLYFLRFIASKRNILIRSHTIITKLLMSDAKNTRETNNPENPNEDEDLIEEFGKEEFEDDYEDEDE